MRNKSYILKKCKTEIIVTLIGLIIILIIAHSNITVAIKIKSLLPQNSNLLSFSLPLLTSILPIIVAVTILIYQLYYNRYIINELKKSIHIDLIKLFTLLGISVFSTFLYWLLGENSFSIYYFHLFCLFYLIIKLFIFIYYYNKISIQYFIDQNSKKIIYEIEHNAITAGKISTTINELDKYFIESIEKKEYIYIRSVITNKTNIFVNYIQNKDKLLINQSFNKHKIDELDQKFKNSIINDFVNISGANLNRIERNHFDNYIYTILETCIYCEKENLFSDISNDLLNISLKEEFDDKELFDCINYNLRKLYKKIIEDNLDSKWEKYIEDFFLKSLIICELFVEDNSKLKDIIVSNFKILEIKLNGIDFEQYSKHYNEVIDYMKQIIKNFDKTESEYLVFSLTKHLSLIIKKSCQEAYDLYVSTLFDLINFSIKAKNENLVLKLGYLVSESLSENIKFEITKEHLEKRMQCAIDCITVYPEVSMEYFPKYELEIKKNKIDKDLITTISDNYTRILYRAIRIENYTPLFFIIHSLNESIKLFEKKDRDNQEIMLNAYKNTLIFCIDLNEYKSFDFVLYNFYDTLKELNINDSISENLLFFIFDIFSSVGDNIIDKRDTDILSKYLQQFMDLSKTITMIETKRSYKEKIVDIIFNYGINSIENRNIQNLKVCSNILGWYGKKLFDSGDDTNYKLVIDLAIQLYNLANEENFDKTVKSFLGTLFIILGSYTYSKGANRTQTYVKDNINKLKDTKPLEISKRLREYRHNYWDDTFEGDSKEAINKFYGKLNL